ncbi:MAG: tetratricopeptide repeat protein [Kiloniellaceae bacterium]
MNEATDTGGQRDRRGRPRRAVGAALALSLAISLAACDDSNVTASQYIDRAKADFEANDLAAGVIELKNALQKEPGNAEGRFLLGRIYVELGDGASAEKELLRARNLGIVEADLAVPLARAYLSQGRYADALDALGTASEKTDAERARVTVLRGSANLGLNDTGAAEVDFRAAIALDPDNADAHIGLARALLPKGAYDEADGELETVLAGAPDNPRALEVKGGLRLLQRRYKEAAEIFQKLVEANPTSSPNLVPLAYSQIALGELDAAIGNLDTRLTAAPDDPRAMYLRGLVAFQKQDYATAKQQSDKVLARNPRDMRATLLSGAASFALNRNEVAYRLLSGYLAEVPNDARARRLLGATELRLGFAEAAAPLAEE